MINRRENHPRSVSGPSSLDVTDSSPYLAESVTAGGHCHICQNAGYYLLDVPPTDSNFGSLITCTCTQQRREQRRRCQFQQASNLQPLENLTFDSFNPTIPGVANAYRHALMYAHKPRGWLVIGGRYGCGKTHLATAIGWQLLKQDYEVLFLTLPDLLDRLQGACNQEGDIVDYRYLDSMRTVHVLILDSFEAPETFSTNHRLFHLLDARYLTRMPTVFTIDMLALDQMHVRIHSRLSDDEICTRVLVEASDYRQIPFLERSRAWQRWKQPTSPS